MPPIRLKVARIGNSRGVRLPADTLARFHVGDELVMEERSDGILLRVPGSATPRLSWEETAAATAEDDEHWAAWDAAAGDGLESLPWESDPARRVAEPEAPRSARPRRRKS